MREDIRQDEELVRLLLKRLGENPDREGLADTPKRMLSAWGEMTSGYVWSKPEEVLKSFADGGQDCDEMVFQNSIQFYSNCEHHLLPFFGVAHIGYLPNGRVVGLSKLARLVDIYARRLQVQERMTSQIADALMRGLNARGAGVVLQARHMCMECRGIHKIGTITTTSALRGAVKDHAGARAEFLAFVTTAKQPV